MRGSCNWPNPEELHLGAAFRQDHSLSTLEHVQGSSAGVPDAGQLLQQVQWQLQAAWPQLQTFMDMPGAIEMRAELLANLSRRFFARTIKMILGPQVILLWCWLRRVSCCTVPTHVLHHENGGAKVCRSGCAVSLPTLLKGTKDGRARAISGEQDELCSCSWFWECI